MFGMRVPDRKSRSKLQQWLAEEGVFVASHYVPLHSAPAGRRYGRVVGNLQETDEMAGRLLRLPLYYSLTDIEQDYVIEKVKSGLNRL